MGLVRFLILASFFGLAFFNTAYADRIKDMADVAGVRSNQLVGYGLVVGLAGTGDGNSGLTLQSMQAMVSRFGLVTDAAGLTATNVAAVMVTADLKPFVKPGQTLDITVSTLGASKSLRGGTLLMTPLLGADGETYAIAQGNLVVGGLGVAGADGSQLVVNIPTVGRIPRGASVERMVPTSFLESENLIFNLHQGDFTTANNMAEGINAMFGPDVAVPLDSSSVRVRAPADPAQRVSFLSLIENIEVDAASPSAKVIVNARTGTVVIGGNVRVTPAAVSHGKMTVKITENTIVTPNGQNVTTNGTTTVATPAAPTITPSSTLEATDTPARAFVFDAGVSLSSLVDAINAVGAAPADLVAILEALREAGALRAELIII
ncbi:MAG: flagellar basal body P-ring protein FlgI [Paracoccaceae bacterium]|jgi:flagellar P-ring protein FlgI|nr:MAG: flagellar biosynthesis protein FlgI [Rhodobacter sp. BACL10 MAG-120910-bin24]MDA1042062.1 flagellar basal body P-ring protein FlgI [Pseudomonadota bacterium]MDO7660462.1 flagellar basal body P-ring protein FlgI [Paracoccaceae bacterium]MDP5357931.1 flagellar basal body P-ring protein FlgI [Paracoccaceae bacterium]MDP5369441.1 flagellar basal body P-ring protein FlgI [Paracoccaceae bacterium]